MGKPSLMFVFTSASQFVALSSGGSTQMCTPSFVVLKTDGDISVPPPTANQPTFTYQGTSYPLYPSAGTSVTVGKGKQPKISFTACDANGSGTAYFLAGLALTSTSAGPGGTAFPETQVNVDSKTGATTLQLQDNNTSSNTYDFWVLVQNAAGSIGLIDPKIVNQP